MSNAERDAAFMAVKAAAIGLVPAQFSAAATPYITDDKILTIASIALEAAPHLTEHVHARAMVKEAVIEMVPALIRGMAFQYITDDKVAIVTDAALSAALKVRAGTADA